jgi:hypothetical protein
MLIHRGLCAAVVLTVACSDGVAPYVLATSHVILPAVASNGTSVFYVAAPDQVGTLTMVPVVGGQTKDLATPFGGQPTMFRADNTSVVSFVPCVISVLDLETVSRSSFSVAGCVGGPMNMNGTETFWFDKTNGLMAMQRAGGAMRVVAGPGTLNPNRAIGLPIDLVLDDVYAYWVDQAISLSVTASSGVVLRTRADGTGSIETLATNQAYPSGIALDAGILYWTNAGDEGQANGSIMRLNLAESTPSVLLSGEAHPTQLAVVGTDVVWIADRYLRTAHSDGTAVRTVTNDATALAMDCTNTYWVGDNDQTLNALARDEM